MSTKTQAPKPARTEYATVAPKQHEQVDIGVPQANNEQKAAYTEALKSGLYAKKTGLVGKYDNVRKYWEDEITRHFLYPHMKKLIQRSQARLRRLRIMDLGCGGADGLELLTGMRDRDANLRDVEVNLLGPNTFGFYKGVDLNQDLLNQARDLYGGNGKICFEQANFTHGLPLGENEESYDLYFHAYATSSHHNDDETMVNLLAEIAQSTRDCCIVQCDWLGRYSYEWPTLWTNDLSVNRNMDYVMSYIYEKEEREQRRDELEHLYLRLMCPAEANELAQRASVKAGVEIKPVCYFDRSTFVARHIETGEYNPNVLPIRMSVNSLFEKNVRTDLSTLIVDYNPQPGFDMLNHYYEHLQTCWNALVEYVSELIELYVPSQKSFRTEPPKIPATYPTPLQAMMNRMRQVVEGVGWVELGLPRENIIEPQLAYALRNLMLAIQQGKGCGHGFCGIFEIDKTK